MKKLQFSTEINAPKEKVWETLWEDSTYRNWTSVFSEGSYAVTDWKEGSKVLFLDAKGEGMFSIIERKIPNELMTFKHMGYVKDGKEQPGNAETEKWSGAMETYTLEETGGVTRLEIEMDVSEDHFDSFSKIFPKALQKVKELSEKSKATTKAV